MNLRRLFFVLLNIIVIILLLFIRIPFFLGSSPLAMGVVNYK